MIGGLFRRLLRDNKGSMLAEAAVSLLVLMTVTLSGVELARYLLLNQKVERIGASVSDLVAQAETISEGDIQNIFNAVQHVVAPFPMGSNGLVIVSSIGASNSSGPVLNWQRAGAGTLVGSSAIGTAGGTVSLPAGMTVIDGETIIVAEVLYDYVPWLYPALVGPRRLYHAAYFRPRFGSLTSVN